MVSTSSHEKIHAKVFSFQRLKLVGEGFLFILCWKSFLKTTFFFVFFLSPFKDTVCLISTWIAPPSSSLRILCSHLSSSSALLLLLRVFLFSPPHADCVQEGHALSVSFLLFLGDSQGRARRHDF